VGPRDGLQNESRVIPTRTKLEFIDRLSDAGLRTIEVAGFVHPQRVPQLADAEEVLAGLKRGPGCRYPVLVPTTKGLQRAVMAGATEIAVFASASETFSHRNLGRGVAEALAMFAPVVEEAREQNLAVRGYVSMVCGDPWEGDVPLGKVVDVSARLMAMGCTELSLGDTTGAGTPGHVTQLLDAITSAGIDVGRVAVHFHDTYGQALANVLASLQAGVRTIDSSAGGLGGCPFAESATGNLATEDLVWMLDGLGVETGVDLDALTMTSMWMAEQLGRPSGSRTVRALASRPAVSGEG
jgi:hydroxymethylglutaryl-CoA lyase